jgi:hypothetical protein
MILNEQVNFQWDDDEIRFVLDQHTELDFYNDSSLKQQSIYTDTLIWFLANQSLLLLLNAVKYFNELQMLYLYWKLNRIIGIIVSVLTLNAVGDRFEPQSSQTKDDKIGICCLLAKYTALRSKSKDWLARNQINVSKVIDASVKKE